MMYEIPTSLTIGDSTYNIRNKGDYRAVLDVIAALNDVDLTDEERVYCALYIFYEDFKAIIDFDTAVSRMMWFISGGEEPTEQSNRPAIMDWEQDFKMIVSPINAIIGQEIRLMSYLHWWTFLAAYYDIGECCFATIISIRQKKLKGQKLEKWERDYYRDNKSLIDIKKRLKSDEESFIDSLFDKT